MVRGEDKFLIRLVHSIGHKQVFFFVWAGIAIFFVWLMVSHYRKVTRRNFRPPGPKAPENPTSKSVITVTSSKDMRVK